MILNIARYLSVLQELHNQRSYRTNLDYEATIHSPALLGECKSLNPGSRRQATLYLRRFPGIRVQIIRGGYVKLHGGASTNDQPILTTLAPLVKTRDSKPPTWTLNKHTLGDKELLTKLAGETYARVRKGDRRGVDMEYYSEVLRPIALKEDKRGIPWHPAHEGAKYVHGANECAAPEKYNPSRRRR